MAEKRGKIKMRTQKEIRGKRIKSNKQTSFNSQVQFQNYLQVTDRRGHLLRSP